MQPYDYSPFQSGFNSIKVRLKRLISILGMRKNTSFNSIKVRLKLVSTPKGSILVPWFQFHKGTIKTDYLLGVLPRAQ